MRQHSKSHCGRLRLMTGRPPPEQRLNPQPRFQLYSLLLRLNATAFEIKLYLTIILQDVAGTVVADGYVPPNIKTSKTKFLFRSAKKRLTRLSHFPGRRTLRETEWGHV
jgi:hypothetical protein